MKMVLIGAGSIGGTLAVLLQENGYELNVVAHGEEKAKALREEGLTLTGVYGDHCEKLNAYPSIDSLDGMYDICMIATKYQQMPALAKAMLPHLKGDSLVVSLQNGLCLDLLADVVGEDRTAGVMIGFGATLEDPTHINVTASAELVVGMKNGTTPEPLKALQEMLNKCLPTKLTTDIEGNLYTKLIFNSLINSLASVTNGPVGHMLKTRHARDAALGIIREAVAVADVMDIDVPRFNILPKFQFLAKQTNPFSQWFWGQFLRLGLAAGSGKVRPSTLQSLEKGMPTEIDIMNGYIATKGKEYGIPTPVNDSLTAIIKEIEAGTRPLSKKNVKDVKLK